MYPKRKLNLKFYSSYFAETNLAIIKASLAAFSSIIPILTIWTCY